MFIENTKGAFAKFLEYSMYGFFALFPFFVFNSFLYQGSSSRFVLLSAVAAVLAIIFGIYLFRKESSVVFYKSPIIIILAIYLVFLFVSALAGVDFATSFWSRSERTSGLFYITHLVPFLLILVHLFSRPETRDRLLKVILVSSGIYSVCVMVGRQGFDIMFRNNPYDGFMFGNSSFAAMYLLGVFLLSIYFVFRKQGIKWFEYLIPLIFIFNPLFINWKLFSGDLTGFADILGIAKASSIALWVSVGILIVSFVIAKIKSVKVRNGAVITTAIVAGLMLLMGTVSLLKSDGLVRSVYEKQTTLARSLVWDISKDAMSQKPITGWGTDNFTVAFQENFDNRLLEAPYGNEPWFDRAHNVFLDQAVDTGYVGVGIYVLVYLVIIGSLLYVVIKSKDRQDRVLGIVLATYFFVHLLELQTAFDTTISMVILVTMTALAVALFEKTRKEQGYQPIVTPQWVRYGIGGVLIVYFGWALLFGTIPFWNVQRVNGEIRSVGKAEKRIVLYEKLFNTKVDLQGILWRTVTDYQQGIAQNPEILGNPEKTKGLLKELDIFTQEYENYVAKHPENFRAHLNLADVYIYHMLFEVNMLDKADAILDRAIVLGPEHPQPFWMKAVTALYRRDFKNAQRYVDMAIAINPEAVETKKLQKYITESIKTFPEIDLYFFNQI